MPSSLSSAEPTPKPNMLKKRAVKDGAVLSKTGSFASCGLATALNALGRRLLASQPSRFSCCPLCLTMLRYQMCFQYCLLSSSPYSSSGYSKRRLPDLRLSDLHRPSSAARWRATRASGLLLLLLLLLLLSWWWCSDGGRGGGGGGWCQHAFVRVVTFANTTSNKTHPNCPPGMSPSLTSSSTPIAPGI